MHNKSLLHNLLSFVLTLVAPALTIVALVQTHPSAASNELLFDSSLAASVQLLYPIPPTATRAPSPSPTASVQPPYPILPTAIPGPATATPQQAPTPTPTLLPTIPPNLSNDQQAVLFVSQRQGIPLERLRLADAYTIQFPLTQQAI